MKKINLIEAVHLKSDVPSFRQGDTINIHVKVTEGDKERIQQYKGLVISRRGSGMNETIVVRKISHGVGVERIFPINVPSISKIEVMKEGRVRRAKLYYLRERTGKAAMKVKERVRSSVSPVSEN